MPEFVFAYRNPVGYTPTPQTRAAWTAWFDGMGQQLADLGKPAVKGCRPDIDHRRVVFPQPEGPTIETISSAPISNEHLSIATRSPERVL